MKLTHAVLLISVFTFAVGSAAAAETPPASPTQPAPVAGGKPGPCHDDIQKFCKDVKPGGGHVHACLGQHDADLAPACRDSRRQAKERVAKFHQACDADVQKLCKDVKTGHGRVAKCLKTKEAELTPACKTEYRASRQAATQLDQ